jgi:hypothetical protein
MSDPLALPRLGICSEFDSRLTREALLKAGGLAMLVATLPAGRALLSLQPGDTAARVPAHLRRATYLPHVGTMFRIRQQGMRPVDVKLTRVADLSPAQSGSEQAFSLLFIGPRRDGFAQDSHFAITHAVLGQVQLAVLPVGARRRGQYYEAIVNRRAA